ncbi:tetratricopeptide repeat protein [uncultured Ligilactobacillus sp.]|uniref:tetratricopeptide repeat protein n=1 Tax=uncultured Ligilactobacillus sp. TaxID=2837633 RepID=UPI00272A280B|nr:tetratricopeptide repeat protein [uncultured Ligilactobacillus sp.]
MKNINLLIKAGDIYFKLKRFEDAKEILQMAYDRTPIGRMIIYRLAEIAVKTKNFEEAESYYNEFVEIAPHDNLKYVLRYKISKAQVTKKRRQELQKVQVTKKRRQELQKAQVTKKRRQELQEIQVTKKRRQELQKAQVTKKRCQRLQKIQAMAEKFQELQKDQMMINKKI